jgi:hypothetical protein
VSAALDPAVLAWALARPVGDRRRGLAEAFAAGTTRVSFEGLTVEYRSLRENSATRRPCVTLASVSRGGSR